MTRHLSALAAAAVPLRVQAGCLGARHLALGLGMAAALLLQVSAALAQTTVAGVTPGALSVDETGSAGYTIPIAVPPGVAGMQPSIALVYKSHGGNGSLGVGWSLSAASSIHRCGQTLAQDQAIHGVDFSADDRFCLDGQRLVAVSGVYGADGTEYRTEIDGFARITSHGTAGSGPLSFTVETKSGQTMDYGNTADARLSVPGQSEVRLWSLNKVSDRLGNAMTYHYLEDTADKSYRLERIEYTRNDAQSVLPQSEVRFLYEARTDTRSSYLAGAELAMTKRLATIEAWTDTGSGLALVKDYRLTYEQSPGTDRSRITAITECDASNTCLQPVGLGWQGQTPGYSNDNVTTSWGMTIAEWSGSRKNAFVLDYNGDGLSDILLQGKTNGNNSVLLTANGTGFDYSVVTNSWGMSLNHWAANQRSLFVLDHNGDGLSDIFLQGKASNEGSYLLTSNGSGFDAVVNVTSAWGMSANHWAGDQRSLLVLDYNGDGLSDVLLHGKASNEGSYLLTSNGSGFDTVANVSNLWGTNPNHWADDQRNLFVVDYNGDGLSDILFQGSSDTQGSYLLTSNGSGFQTVENVTNTWGMTIAEWSGNRKNAFILDYNGDGLSDILLQGKSDTNASRLLTSNGSGFNTVENINMAWGMTIAEWSGSRKRIHILDHNGDGLSDILLQGKSDTNASRLLTSNGGGFNTVENINTAWGMSLDHWATNQRNLFVLDRNGDGLADLLMQGTADTEGSRILTHDGPTSDLLTSVTDSLGRVSTLAYAPLTDGAVYSKDSDAVFPVVDIQAPLYVVKSVSSDDGLGGQKVTSYSYAGAKVHVQGRGFRGFRQMTATDQQTGIVTSTTYEQVFPYTAQVKTSVKTLSDGTKIKTIDNTWASLSLNGNSTVYPYVSTSVSEDYEINDGLGNSPVVSRSATAVFDSFGNPTSLTTTTTDGTQTFTETTTNAYTNDTVNWLLGLLTRAEVTRSR